MKDFLIIAMMAAFIMFILFAILMASQACLNEGGRLTRSMIGFGWECVK